MIIALLFYLYEVKINYEKKSSRYKKFGGDENTEWILIWHGRASYNLEKNIRGRIIFFKGNPTHIMILKIGEIKFIKQKENLIYLL